MGIEIDVDTFLNARRSVVIDVRSPGEFRHGHIPGAHSVPLFDDAERAEIGTLYKQVGRLPAIVRGMEVAGAKADRLVKAVQDVVGSGPEVVVHCWRGGMRSEGVAWLLTQCGYRPSRLLGGYKAFRREAQSHFAQPRRVIILGGHSGAGKTQLLHALRKSGEQVIDLESLANHRGSAFGGIMQPPQPTVEQFENELFLQWRDLDPGKRVWIEGESQAIGKIFIPAPIWKQMSDAPTIFVEVDRQRRAEFLVEQYGELPAEDLAAAITKIRKRLGGARLKLALAALDCNDVLQFASIALEYYDRAYSNSLRQRPPESLVRVRMSMPGQSDVVPKLIKLAHRFAASSRVEASELDAAELEVVVGEGDIVRLGHESQ